MSELFWFVVTAMLVITVHEAGHLFVAIWCGIEVKRFSIGFGRPLVLKTFNLRSQRQPLEVTVCPIPLGGYVSFETGQEGGPNAYENAPLMARVATVFAGPLANFLLALVIWTTLAWSGQTVLVPRLAQPAPEGMAHESGLRAGDWVRSLTSGEGISVPISGFEQFVIELRESLDNRQPVTLDVERNGQRLEVAIDLSEEGLAGRPATWATLGLSGVWVDPVLTQVMPAGPAAKAGLKAGDRVLSVNDQIVDDALGLKRIIWSSAKTNPPQPQTWQVLRDGQTHLFSVSPERVVVDGVAQGRVQVLVGSAPERQLVKLDLSDALNMGLERIWGLSREMGKSLMGLFDAKPSPSVQLVGPVGLAQMASEPATTGAESWWPFVASLSLSLAWLNLLPIPVLDGGQLIFLGLEAVVGQSRSDHLKSHLNRVGVVLLLGLMGWAIYNDLIRVFSDSVIPR